MTNELPIIANCDGCSCCCMEQESPPGYGAILSGVGWPDEEDVERCNALPSELRAELVAYIERVRAGKPHPHNGACIWMDPLLKRCRHHEHRPNICREFEVGSKSCVQWRNKFKPEIDPGIRRLVDLLNGGGFPTIGSCEGGEGHQFARPTVQVRPPGDLDNARKRLAEFLIERGAQGFTLRTVCLHQTSAEPEEYSFVELEFWGQVCWGCPDCGKCREKCDGADNAQT